MPLPEIELHRVEKRLSAYCEKRIPRHVRDQVRLSFQVTGNKVHLYESRPSFPKPEQWVDMKIAQFEYNPTTRRWTLYCFDRNSRRRPYHELPGELDFESLLAEVDKDPTGFFWG